MHKKIAIWSIVFISLLGCRTITANYPRDISSIKLDNGVKITLELNEDIMVFLDPKVTKKITIDYGKRQLEHRSNHDDYDYRIFLIEQEKDTIWVLEEEDRCERVECSFSNKKAKFLPRYSEIIKGGHRDTLLKIKYVDFVLSIE